MCALGECPPDLRAPTAGMCFAIVWLSLYVGAILIDCQQSPHICLRQRKCLTQSHSFTHRSRRRASDGCGISFQNLHCSSPPLPSAQHTGQPSVSSTHAAPFLHTSGGVGVSSSSTQPLSIASLQTELRSLCVSSPPSLQTSPIHVPMPGCAVASGQAILGSASSAPLSPPPLSGVALHIISEENLNLSNSQQIISPNSSAGMCPGSADSMSATHSPVSLPSSPLHFLGYTFTPPQSFRTSPSVSPSPQQQQQHYVQTMATHAPHAMTAQQQQHMMLQQAQLMAQLGGQPSTPAISVTDELGQPAGQHYPIIPPPFAFAAEFAEASRMASIHHQANITYSQPNLGHQRMSLDEGCDSQQVSDSEDRDDGQGYAMAGVTSSDVLVSPSGNQYSKLYRWKDGNKAVPGRATPSAPPVAMAYGP